MLIQQLHSTLHRTNNPFIHFVYNLCYFLLFMIWEKLHPLLYVGINSDLCEENMPRRFRHSLYSSLWNGHDKYVPTIIQGTMTESYPMLRLSSITNSMQESPSWVVKRLKKAVKYPMHLETRKKHHHWINNL